MSVLEKDLNPDVQIGLSLPMDHTDGSGFFPGTQNTLTQTTSNIQNLLLTAKGEPEERIKGLEMGADDYLPKPFEPKELDLRIKNIINKTKENNLSIAHEGSKNDSGEVLHQGIAARAFKLQFSLAPEVVVKSANLKNGLLKINLERIIPESEKAKVIQINSGELIEE